MVEDRNRTTASFHTLLTLALALFACVAYSHVPSLPFVNDDYVFLDRVRRIGFFSLWLPFDLPFVWFRPWSREFHYWWLDRVFGAAEFPAHLVSLGLWLMVLNLYAALAARLAGTRAAWVSAAAVAALSLWGMPVSWVAGAQDLWMLAFGFAFLLLVLTERRALPALAMLFALASKENALLLLPIAAAMLWARAVPLAAIARRLAPATAGAVGWMLIHPLVRQRLAGGGASAEIARPAAPLAALQTLLAPLNLGQWPQPQAGWISVLIAGGLGALLLGGLVWWKVARTRAASGGSGRRFAIAVALWTLIGWAPLALPAIGWHAYYGVLGTLGLWIGLGAALARRPTAALLAVVALVFLRQAAASTPSWDWGTEWYQRRAAAFLGGIRAQLLSRHPTLPPRSRLFFARMPNDIGLLAGDGPALRVWYGDSTLRAHYYSAYRPRPAGAPGADYFFRFDTTTGSLKPVLEGPESPEAAQTSNPEWARDHEVLAVLLVEAGELDRGLVQYRKLADAFPDDPSYPLFAGVLLEMAGRAEDAEPCYRRASPYLGGMDTTRMAAAELRATLEAAKREKR